MKTTHNQEQRESNGADASGSGITQDPKTIEANLYRLASRVLKLQQQCTAAGYEKETGNLRAAILNLTAAAYTLSEREK